LTFGEKTENSFADNGAYPLATVIFTVAAS